MGAARGIAGSIEPEEVGCFLCRNEAEAEWFVRMNNTGGPVDVWAVDRINPELLVQTSNGFMYLPGRILPGELTLLRCDIPSEPR